MTFVSSPISLEFSSPRSTTKSIDPCDSGACCALVSPSAASSFVFVVVDDDA